MSELVNNIYDRLPPIGPAYTPVRYAGRIGMLVPFVTFDETIGNDLKEKTKRSIDTGIMPMALLFPAASEAVHTTLTTHPTKYSEWLKLIQISEVAGSLPKGASGTAMNEILQGNFDPEAYDLS